MDAKKSLPALLLKLIINYKLRNVNRNETIYKNDI